MNEQKHTALTPAEREEVVTAMCLAANAPVSFAQFISQERMEAALTALESRGLVGGAWQPIETLPKGVEQFLGYCPNYYVGRLGGSFAQVVVCEQDTGAHFGFAGSHGKDHDGPLNPTHWLPLPKPPQQPQEEDE